MSAPSEIEVTCSSCGTSQVTTIWASVNATNDPELKAQLLKGELCTFTCRHCGEQDHIAHDLLYNDTERKFMVFLAYSGRDENGRLLALPNPLQWARQVHSVYSRFSPLTDEQWEAHISSYKYRVVASYDELREKIRIFDDDLDDRHVEFVKGFAYHSLFRRGITDFGPLLYSQLAGKESQRQELVFFQQIAEGVQVCARDGCWHMDWPFHTQQVSDGIQAYTCTWDVYAAFLDRGLRDVLAQRDEREKGCLVVDMEYALGVVQECNMSMTEFERREDTEYPPGLVQECNRREPEATKRRWPMAVAVFLALAAIVAVSSGIIWTEEHRMDPNVSWAIFFVVSVVVVNGLRAWRRNGRDKP